MGGAGKEIGLREGCWTVKCEVDSEEEEEEEKEDDDSNEKGSRNERKR